MNGAHKDKQLQSDPSREASRWLVELQDAPEDASLQAAFDIWLAQLPAHRKAWEETLRVSAQLNRLAPPGEYTSRKRTERGSTWLHAFRRPRAKAALVTITACAALAFLAGPQIVLRLEADAMTTTGAPRMVKLDDGSRVHLAPDSAISVALGPTRRRVHLLRGEAWFDVHHDPERPFVVDTVNDHVTVLGTAFDVRRGPNGTDVAVERGRVAVHLANQPPIGALAAGDALLATRSGHTRRRLRPDRVASWREGRAIVQERTVADLIDQLRPWYAGYILVRGNGAASHRVTGVFDLREPDRALDALSRLEAISVTRATPWLRIITVR